ncbi:4-hydroxy-tetrahydrodipicolinate reductase [Halobacteriales archaeon QS_4_69_34]|nr:MAG: 4-hydroxy-tetrahydrodipicolinate reductase [Halobacteriales archaeon QS_4_69_34]
MTAIGVTGATGRMGRAVLDAAADRPDASTAFALARDPEGTAIPAGGGERAPVVDATDLPRALAEFAPDAVVDFTAPAATVEYAVACAEAGVPFVTGTTGLDDEQDDTLGAASERIPVLHASNFSRGVQALLAATVEAVGALPGYDVELTETHHDGKRDAPSGTATTLLDAIDGVRGNDPADRVHGREGDHPRQAGAIGVHARRAGDVHGEHELLVAGNDELLTLTHRAESRGVFAAGALDAADWLAGREPGRYGFGAVVGDGGAGTGTGTTPGADERATDAGLEASR